MLSKDLDRNLEEGAILLSWIKPGSVYTLGPEAFLSTQLRPINPYLQVPPGHVFGTKPYLGQEGGTKL